MSILKHGTPFASEENIADSQRFRVIQRQGTRLKFLAVYTSASRLKAEIESAVSPIAASNPKENSATYYFSFSEMANNRPLHTSKEQSHR